MSDAADISSPNETAFIEDAISRHRYKTAGNPPEFNTLGQKVCTECDNVIPPKRAEIPWVSTCIDCQTLEEQIERRSR